MEDESPAFRMLRQYKFSIALALVVVVLLLNPFGSSRTSEEPPTVCLVNMANNPRTASIFSRGDLERHGSVNTFKVVKATEGCHHQSTRLQLVTVPQLMEWCLGDEICILTGDEDCDAPAVGAAQLRNFLLRVHLWPVVPRAAARGYRQLQETSRTESNYLRLTDGHESQDRQLTEFSDFFDHDLSDSPDDEERRRIRSHLDAGVQRLRPNTILREFYSSKYDYPGIPLGARYEFERPTKEERDSGNRPLLFNFMGSIKIGQELDREHLRDVINGHNWKVPSHVKMFDDLVRNPNSTTVDEYRETLLASSFTLAPVGTADDCFRFWEAIEAGSIPVYVRRVRNVEKKAKCPDAFEDVLAANPPIVLLDDWDDWPKFAETVEEHTIEEMRRKLVLWSNDWWTKTAQSIDNAISKAVNAREKANAVVTAEQLQQRESDISDALKVLKDQQTDQRDKTKKQHDAMVREVEEEKARKKQLKQDSKTKGKLSKKDKVKETKTKLIAGDEAVAAVAKELGIDSTVGATVEATIEIVGAVISSPALEQTDLEQLQFSFLHDVVINVLAATDYLNGFFSADELDPAAPYLRWWLNKASFIDKVIRAVCRDLGLPGDYIQAYAILNNNNPAQTRMFLCFLAHVAEQSKEDLNERM